jgi:type IV secretion system protein VirB11
MSAHFHPVVAARQRSALAKALGAGVSDALDAPDVVEALVNADGRLWLDRVGKGLELTPHTIAHADREAAIRLLAHAAGERVGDDRPMLAATLPGNGARVQAMLSPLVDAPILSIRKRPSVVFTLAEYVVSGVATDAQAASLAAAVAGRRNIIVAGGTGSGKTTLLNALLAEPGFAEARLVVLEDTAELQISAANAVKLLTKRTHPEVTLRHLVQASLRLRPDRIVVGEVRDGAALEVLKAWNTGHPGGLLTLHANSAEDAITRLEDLCIEAGLTSPERVIASSVDMIVFMARTPLGRTIEDIVFLKGRDHRGPYRLARAPP